MDEFKTLLKKEIIRVLNLNGMQPEEIDDDAPLFGEGLGYSLRFHSRPTAMPAIS